MRNSNELLPVLMQQALEDCFAKITVCDQSIDLDNISQQIFSYYADKVTRQRNEPAQYEFVDLFCGAGGLSVGLEQEGFRPVLAVDNNAAAIKTYRFNRPWMTGNDVFLNDIRKLVNQDVFPHVSVVVGGPPCQGFSVVNQHKKENDERNQLYKYYVQAVSKIKPKLFLIENVEGILQLYDLIREDFNAIGYFTCKPILLNTKDFGFPQSRKRAFVLGISNEYHGQIDELYSAFLQAIDQNRNKYSFTLWDAISDLPKLEAKTQKNATYAESKAWGYTFAGMWSPSTAYTRLINSGLPTALPLLNHKSKYNNDRDIQIFQLLKQGEKSDAESIQDLNPYKNRSDMFRDKFDKLTANEICKTITAHMYYDCNMYIHPYQARGLSPREAARVQGFPDDYLFLGTPNEWYRQIGNAVSPLMARVLAKGLKSVLERITE